jgi:antirestriction protein ArdC
MNIYQTVTERILNQLDAGVIPWRKTWMTAMPKSLTTAKEYRGINILVLAAAGYDSRYWVTYREAQRLGGYVRKGQKATPVVYWHWRTQEEIEKRQAETGKDRLAPCVPFFSAVFNLDQVEGIPRPVDDVPLSGNIRLDLAEQLYEVMPDKPEIVHSQTSAPAYSPAADQVTMPRLSQFESAEEYYATLFHELTHATGHRKRLNRFADVPNNRFASYSFEELVAEFGAAFLCAFTGIGNPAGEALQASYIAGWAKAIRQDQRLIVRAASAAQTAADYIRGKLPARTAGADSEPAPLGTASDSSPLTCQPAQPVTTDSQTLA